MLKITVYGRQSCAPCRTLKQFLDKKGLEFTAKDIDKDEEAAIEALQLASRSIIPVIVIDKDGDRTVVTGLNFNALLPALE